jgi:hypothetical protein
MKLIWTVEPAPVGRYKAFSKRGWPGAVFATTRQAAVMLTCENEYIPSDVRRGTHGPIAVWIADWTPRDLDPTATAFTWRRVSTSPTLRQAKVAAQRYITTHPALWPKELRP